MKPIALLVSMLMLSAVIGRGNGNLAGDEAETEPLMNDKAQQLRKRETYVCGNIKVGLSDVNRRDSRFNGTKTSDVSVDDPPNLSRIAGGSFTTYGEVPWMATILYKDRQVCGGSIIGEFWVITAAHCFDGAAGSSFTVAVGDHRLGHKDLHEVTHKLAQITIHEKHRPKHYGSDIALIKIKPTANGRGIQFNNYVQPICLPSSTDIPPVGTRLTFSGWGKTYAASLRSELLKKTILPVLAYRTCKQLYEEQVTRNMFCAGYIEGDTEGCPGDSGGLATSKSAGSNVLYGVYVFGNKCKKPFDPAGFVSVPLFRSWIDANIKRYGRGSEINMPVRSSTSSSTT